ncbi:MAG: winged helix-turn-helix domain-containing protein [Thermoplasmata archaeon]|nr:winged helix-turn-helix domain-containing protein [Thermoplasmata archaeon]
MLHAMADEQSRRILTATSSQPRSAMDLIREEGLPSSSAYRRIHELQDEGLLGVARTVLTADGKKYQMYKAAFREVNVSFRGGEVVVTAVPNQDVVQRAFRLFQSFGEELG